MIKKFVSPENKTEHRGAVIDSKDSFDVIECESCGFKHIIPIPTQKELDKLYQEEFYTTKKPKYFKEVEEDLEWWNITYKSYYGLFEKYCLKGKRLLEIGSGPGYFLKCGKDLGWEVLGTEPSKQAYEYSVKLGVNVVNGFFGVGNINKYGKFDVVYMNTVIEHLPDPISLIKNVKKALAPRGIICIVAPNDYNPLQNVLREKLGFSPWWLSPPQHINYFDFNSIKKLLEKLGFEIVESLGTFPMEFFLLSGDNYVDDNELGRKCHFKRKTFENNMQKYSKEYLELIYKFLSEQGIGREFVVIGKIKEEEGSQENKKEIFQADSPCRVCGSRKFQPKITKKLKNLESTWVECQQCKVQRIYPYPTAEEVARYYEKYLSRGVPGIADHAKRFSEEYKETVFKNYQYSLSDLGVENKDLLKMRILDFGCANGIFLDYLNKLGAKKENLFGIEISKELADVAKGKGYKVFTSLSFLGEEKFDLITLWDVIEHLENPRETIMDLKRVMRKRTRVLIETPRIGFLSNGFGEEFCFYLPIEHIHLFPRETLLGLFNELGFRITKTGSFGANASETMVPQPYKSVFDRLAKMTDNGVSQLALFEIRG